MSQSPAKPVPSDEAGVEHKGQQFRGLTSTWDASLDTQRFCSAKGLVPDGADLFMPLLHGMGPITSHAGSMFATLNALTASKKKSGRSQSLKLLRQLEGYRIVGAEAIDLPAAHGRDVPLRCSDLAGLCDWVIEWLAPIKHKHGLPIVPVARSAAAMIVLGVQERRPDLVNAVVFLSPMAPFDAEHSNDDLLRRVAASECELNHAAFDYMNRLTEQTDWDQRCDPFGGTPALILTGELDTQVSDRVREKGAAWSDRLQHVDYCNVLGAGHDVLNLRNREPGLVAYAELFSFLGRVFGGP